MGGMPLPHDFEARVEQLAAAQKRPVAEVFDELIAQAEEDAEDDAAMERAEQEHAAGSSVSHYEAMQRLWAAANGFGP